MGFMTRMRQQVVATVVLKLPAAKAVEIYSVMVLRRVFRYGEAVQFHFH